jgi:hypothetical protein
LASFGTGSGQESQRSVDRMQALALLPYLKEFAW